MSLNLSIKNVPDDLVERLRKRAAVNHRSLQGELLSIIEQIDAEEIAWSIDQVADEARRLSTAPSSSSVDLIRADRDRDERRESY